MTNSSSSESWDPHNEFDPYAVAVAADEAAIKRGDYNFKGIGWTPSKPREENTK